MNPWRKATEEREFISKKGVQDFAARLTSISNITHSISSVENTDRKSMRGYKKGEPS